MATCNSCYGGGYVDSLYYESCSTCGGSGNDGYTIDSVCRSCNGSGKSNRKEKVLCNTCCGNGSIADPEPDYSYSSKKDYRSSASKPKATKPVKKNTSKPKPGPSKVKPKNQADEDAQGVIGVISFLIAAIAAIAGYVSNDVGGAIGMGALGYFGAYIALTVCWYLLKILWVIFQWAIGLGIILLIGSGVIQVIGG